MNCFSCGAPVNDEGTYNFDPNVDKPPYVKPESVLRQEARDEDWRLGFRALASSIGKGATGSAWDKAVETRKLILHSWDAFLLEKYGPDRGLDCTLPVPVKWEKQIHPLDWLLLKFADDNEILSAIAAFDG
jgi:hypothetical protein